MPTLEWIGKDKVINHHLDRKSLLRSCWTFHRNRTDLLCITSARMAKDHATQPSSKEGRRRGHRDLKKINDEVQKPMCYVNHSESYHGVRLLFQDEAGFGRINKPKYCWCQKGVRPSVPCHHIREYHYAYGAVEPLTGDSCFLVMPYCNTACMNIFLKELSKQFPTDMILLCCDGAAWHKAGNLVIPDNIKLFFIPPYTPEMNPIEQIWKQLRKMAFRNEVFSTLAKMVDRLCDVICSLSADTIRSITARKWIVSCFN